MDNQPEKQPFLKCIAQAYTARYSDLSDILFVFPSKRSGSFFLKYLSELSETDRFAPQITTIADFLTDTSGLLMDNRLDLLFTLYDAYRGLAKDSKKKVTDDDSFNAFRKWGDVIISDFSAVDMSGVNAEEIFKNVKDHRDIQTNFETDDQLKVLEEYFGISVSKDDRQNFWKHIDYSRPSGKTKRNTDIRNSFRRLWSILWPLYERFNHLLDERGMSYVGKTYKTAYQKIKEGCEIDAKKIVFVGFNVLTKMEWLIFDSLMRRKTIINGHEESFADFIWDATGPVLGAQNEPIDDTQSAVRFVSRNKKNFPEPAWAQEYLRKADFDKFPDVMEVHASPSDSIQAKIAGDILYDLRQSLDNQQFTDAKVAMVLPDEGLLFPAIYSLPAEIGDINLTMGYPIKMTPTISFVDRLRYMQLRQRSVGGEISYFHEDLMLLLGHPLTQKLITPRAARKIKEHIIRFKKYTLTVKELNSFTDHCEFLWKSVRDKSADDVIKYIDYIMECVSKTLFHGIEKPEDKTSPEYATYSRRMHNARLENSHISIYRDALRRLRDAIHQHNLDLNAETVFALADKLIASERVTLKGEPLRGLQIMGLLETRCLDFDAIVLPSMNEKIFPMRMRTKTFIPDSLRRGYGMPPARYEEAVFAYYFYRLISRAKQVYMIYDARVGGLKSGDLSRYVLQLQHLYAKDKLKFIEHSYTLTSPVLRQNLVEKTGEVKKRLDLFFDPESKFTLSASALQSYMNCPLQFFFKYVACFNADNEPSEFIDASTSGTVVHGALEDLYLHGVKDEFKEKLLPTPVQLTSEYLSKLINEPNRQTIRDAVEARLRYHYLHQKTEEDKKATLPEDAKFNLDVFSDQVAAVINYDLMLTQKFGDITLRGAEISETIPFRISGNRFVNMRYAIDRLDSYTDKNGHTVNRIVDYKTGEIHLEAQQLDQIFDGTKDAKYIFQPLLYANLINLTEFGKMTGNDITAYRPEIYGVLSILSGKKRINVPEIEGVKVETHLDILDIDDERTIDLNSEILQRTDKIITEIFDTTVPFKRCTDSSKCDFCNFKPFCGM